MHDHGGDIFATARRMGWDWKEVLDLSANINPLGIPRSARKALAAADARIVHYPEIGAPELRETAARCWGIDENQVVIGNGATELIYAFIRHLRPARTLLIVPAFSEYRRALAGSCIVPFRLERSRGYQIEFEELSRAIRQVEPDLVVLANPNNPTGAIADAGRLRKWLQAEHVPVLLDESFIDFTGGPSCVALTGKRSRLFVLRSLTKFFALPGLRVGCLVADRRSSAALAAAREPWQVNALAERAAIAALEDAAYARRSLELILTERAWWAKRLANIEALQPVPTGANFCFAHVAQAVGDLQRHLLPHKMLIRDCTGMEGVDGAAFRFAIRTRRENRRFFRLLQEFFQ